MSPVTARVITRTTAKNAVVPTSIEGRDPEKQTSLLAAQAEKVELDGRKAFFDLRSTWSGWIIAWISILILFNMLLTVAVGLAWVNFEKYAWFITAVTVETFLQIVGMGLVAVNFLFSDKRK